jgi:hypothetical protein
MADTSGLKMRIIALDELMKCCQEIGRNTDKPDHRDFARALFEVAKIRHEFLSASRTDTDKEL